MKVIFLSIGGFDSIDAHDQYPDLLREFRKNGHDVCIVCSNEKRTGLPTELIKDNGVSILRVSIGNVTQSHLLEKGIATLLIGRQYKKAIKRFFKEERFDLALYTTPPITLVSVVEYIKRKYHAKTFLILKDIFPQNAVDIGIMSKEGMKGLIYKYFRRQEKRLYSLSDIIGTMSKANTDYILKNNPEIEKKNVCECPNCLDAHPIEISKEERKALRNKYDIPQDKTVFVYGGNLGKPQDIPFVLKCIQACKDITDAYFWIIGNGTEYHIIEDYIRTKEPTNLKLSNRLPKEDYDRLIAACDVGLIFLDHRFTIPNFPSRMLAYMQAGLPVLACTDINTDIGVVISEGEYGWWCESDDPANFIMCVNTIISEELQKYSLNARKKLPLYSSENSYKVIIERAED